MNFPSHLKLVQIKHLDKVRTPCVCDPRSRLASGTLVYSGPTFLSTTLRKVEKKKESCGGTMVDWVYWYWDNNSDQFLADFSGMALDHNLANNYILVEAAMIDEEAMGDAPHTLGKFHAMPAPNKSYTVIGMVFNKFDKAIGSQIVANLHHNTAFSAKYMADLLAEQLNNELQKRS